MPDTVVSIYQATLTFAVAAIALLASPGPATLALAASGAAYGMKRSVEFFLGITLGLVVAMTVVGTGLYVVLHSFPVVATVLTGISILYILSLAYRIGTAPPIKDEQAVVSPGWGAGFVLGPLTSRRMRRLRRCWAASPWALRQPGSKLPRHRSACWSVWCLTSCGYWRAASCASCLSIPLGVVYLT